MSLSMTGFARKEVQQDWGSLSCEIRSVNHRYLEPSFRLPDTLKSAEPQLRETLRKQLSRGKIDISLSLKTEVSDNAQLGLNETLAQRIIELTQALHKKIDNPAPLDAIDILSWPGVIQTSEIDNEILTQAAQHLFSATLKQLLAARQREGGELTQLIEQRLTVISDHVKAVRIAMPAALEQHRNKLRAKVDALKIEVDEDRFSQEAIYIAQKSDVAEELDRLDAHISEVRHTLKQSGPIGRRLDFLMQEFNREANTLSSKSITSDITQRAVDIKVMIEQMREQIQNIE